ncbi:MAG: sensor histidine kinase [Pseudomonadales bacterium]
MRLASVLSGSAFKLALQLFAALVAMLVLAGFLLVSALSNTLEAELRAQVEEEVILLGDIYRNQGREGLVRSIAELREKGPLFERELGLFDSEKLHLAGAVSLLPDFVGWGKTQLTLAKPAQDEGQYRVKVVHLAKLSLVVGRSGRAIEAARAQLITWLCALGALLSIGVLLLGYTASAKSYRKLRAMSGALEKVVAGTLAERVVVGRESDQIDLIAQQVNGHLDHLARLVGGIQASASAIAHDLKTPLSHAQIALYEARDQVDERSDSAQHIDTALDKLQQLNTTFDTILRISRIQLHSDRSAFALQPIERLLENVVELLEPLAQQAEMTLTTSLNLQDGELRCDRAMLQQLLINLVNNAIVHCPAHTRIELGVEEAQSQIRLTVSDNGPGIPAARYADIFEPFSRLSTSRTTPGNGLGLALVKAIAEQHGADIQLSDAAPGLCVSVIFPLAESD